MTAALERDSTIAGIPTYGLCAGLGAVGFVETSYLTFIKLTGGDAICPVGGGSCGDVLNSDYAVIFGIPLPLFGMVAYGTVASLGVQLAANNFLFGLGKTDARLSLLGLTTSMATASAFFLYILSTKFAGVSCSYCLFSAALSFSLFFCTLKDFGLQEIQKVVGLQLALAGIVVAALSGSYSSLQPPLQGSNDFELEPFETEITTKSSPFAISLAKHLHSIGAKMYGAFWCSHCVDQKQMFGQEAMKILDYVECFPNGAGKGRSITQECADVRIEGFPTWIINEEVISGEQDLQTLAKLSGFVGEGFDPSSVPDKQ